MNVSRDFLKSQLRRISGQWPLQASPEVLDEYSRCLWGFTEDEIRDGFSHVIDTYLEAAAPKTGHIRAAVGQVARARRAIVAPEVDRVNAGEPAVAFEPDYEVIARWAASHTAEVEAQIDSLISTWDAASQMKYRHVLRHQATRLCYQRAAMSFESPAPEENKT